jgi:cell wall-associated NlpC family hydrolase
MHPDTSATPREGDLVFYASWAVGKRKRVRVYHHVGIYVGEGTILDEPHAGGFLQPNSVRAFGKPEFYSYVPA